jgi:hypothetical protein
MAYQVGNKLEIGHVSCRVVPIRTVNGSFHGIGSLAVLCPEVVRGMRSTGKNIPNLEKEIEQLQCHMDLSSLEAALARAEAWTLDEAMMHVLNGES